jgi:hypothetical protein
MSLTLDLPELTTSELAGSDLTGSDEIGVSGGWDESGSILPEDETRAFVNNSLANIQNFFSRMIQLDPQEDELFGETGRDVNGFRLTTEDEPPGVDHDTAISIRSDHISNLSIQSGKASTSDALLNMGTWDSTLGIWGVQGALRIDMSASSSFSMESNYGALTFNNVGPADDSTAAISPQPAAILESVNALVLKNRPGARLPTETAEGAGFYAASGVPYAFDSSGNSYNLTTVGSGITVSGDYTITGDWTINGEWTFGSVAGFPKLPATTTFTEPNTGFGGTAPFSSVSRGLVTNLNAEFLDGRAGSTIPDTTAAADITGVWSFVKIEAGTGNTIGIGTDATNPKDIQLFFAYLNTGTSSATQTIETIATTIDTVFILEATITAINACSGGTCNSGDGACYIIRQLFKNDNGTVTAIGTLDAVFTREEVGPAPGGNMEDCEVSLLISGTSVLVQVTGITGGTGAVREADIKWNAVTKIYNALP